MELELKEKSTMSREDAAARLHAIADELASGNDIILRARDGEVRREGPGRCQPQDRIRSRRRGDRVRDRVDLVGDSAQPSSPPTLTVPERCRARRPTGPAARSAVLPLAPPAQVQGLPFGQGARHGRVKRISFESARSSAAARSSGQWGFLTSRRSGLRPGAGSSGAFARASQSPRLPFTFTG